MKVGVFDSGVGGLTVLKELVKNKKNNYLYVGDSLNMPYGAKSKEELRACVDKIMNYFVKENVDIVIIACGTVSSTLYEDLVKDYNVKIYDIISPTVKYIKDNNIDNLGVIATVNTIKSNVFQNALSDRNVVAHACPDLAFLIESDSPNIEEYLDGEFNAFKDKEIEYIVLGCTHYPVVDNIIKEKYNYKTINLATPLLEYIKDDEEFSVDIKFTKVTNEVINNVKRIMEKEYSIEEIEL